MARARSLQRGPQMEPHMRPSDAFSWYMERDPLLRSTVVAVGLLDRPPHREALRATLDRATRVVPGMHHVVLVPPLRLSTPRWTRTDEVDLDWHIRWETIAAPGDLEAVLAIAEAKAMTAFDPARPLWEVTVIGGLAGGRAAFVLKFHHALTDGIGGMRLASELFDLDRVGTQRAGIAESPAEHLGGVRLALDSLAHDAGRLVGLARSAPATAARTGFRSVRNPLGAAADVVNATRSVVRTVEPFRTTLSPVMRERRLGRSLQVLDVPLGGLRAASAAVDGHLNDAFLGAVTGGLRIYHERHGAEVTRLRVTMPISVRTDADGPGGNRITLARFLVPVGLSDVRERMVALHRLTAGWRAEPSLGLTQNIAEGLNLLPSALIGGMLKHVDFLASNVPGFPIPVFLAGAELEGYYGFGPTIGSAVNVTLMSNVDTCNIGVNCDTGAIPDSATFLECLRAGFAEVLAVAGQEPEVTAWRS